MFKFVLFAVLALVCTETVFGLKCYVSDPDISKTEEECMSYLPRKAKEIKSLSENLKINWNKVTPACYKVQAEANNGTKFVVQGCTVKKLCDIPMGVIKKESKKRGLIVTTTCYSCDEDLCN